MEESLGISIATYAQNVPPATYIHQEALIDALGQVWLCGAFEPDLLPLDLRQDRVVWFLKAMQSVLNFALAIANGDLSASLGSKGRMAGSLKSLQASLRHLTWQTQKIAQCDFSQRIDFMGEFSQAFNGMVQCLADARHELQESNRKLHAKMEENRLLQEQLLEQAIRDPHTNLFNRRFVLETLDREVAEAQRENHGFSAIMLDIDHPKNFNDTHGHKAGDLVIKAMAELLHTQTRASNVVCRYGGEEFIALLPGAPLDVARSRAILWRERMEGTAVWYEDRELKATLSMGVAVYPQHGTSGEQLMRSADEALYAAKSSGRNFVIVWNNPGMPIGRESDAPGNAKDT